MKSNLNLPAVVIAGKKNVGKSSIFNKLVGFRRSLVADYEGLTRDPVISDINLEGKNIRIVDLPGYFVDPADDIEKSMNDALKHWIAKASLVIFVIDGRTNITEEDEEVADIIRKSGKDCLLTVNKAEGEAYKKNLDEIYSISMGDPIFVSAEHNIGFETLIDVVLKRIPDFGQSITETTVRVSIVGRPNVGKSSLLNALINESLSIVTDIPGTTRDTIDASFNYKGREILFIDTAGLRRRSRVEKGTVESFSGARTIRAIMNSDISLLVVDASEKISDQDKKIASMILKYSKAPIVVLNKWDIAKAGILDEAKKALFFISYSPFVPLSAAEKWNTNNLMKEIVDVYDGYTSNVQTSKIANASSRFSAEHSISSKLKLFYATQTGTSPPTISVFVNFPELFDDSMKRSYENFLRKQIDNFAKTPLKIIVRARRES
ncbi:MAG: ribosome biogenesis GTPase Der [Thermotogae bacterium]|nr:ribosome biogenesis GTPase Der [Thermotogota bacterium]MCL5033450.1 ribosome biogenesis GTPase Der [Thermotogota bacterium]